MPTPRIVIDRFQPSDECYPAGQPVLADACYPQSADLVFHTQEHPEQSYHLHFTSQVVPVNSQDNGVIPHRRNYVPDPASLASLPPQLREGILSSIHATLPRSIDTFFYDTKTFVLSQFVDRNGRDRVLTSAQRESFPLMRELIGFYLFSSLENPLDAAQIEQANTFLSHLTGLNDQKLAAVRVFLDNPADDGQVYEDTAGTTEYIDQCVIQSSNSGICSHIEQVTQNSNGIADSFVASQRVRYLQDPQYMPRLYLLRDLIDLVRLIKNPAVEQFADSTGPTRAQPLSDAQRQTLFQFAFNLVRYIYTGEPNLQTVYAGVRADSALLHHPFWSHFNNWTQHAAGLHPYRPVARNQDPSLSFNSLPANSPRLLNSQLYVRYASLPNVSDALPFSVRDELLRDNMLPLYAQMLSAEEVESYLRNYQLSGNHITAAEVNRVESSQANARSDIGFLSNTSAQSPLHAAAELISRRLRIDNGTLTLGSHENINALITQIRDWGRAGNDTNSMNKYFASIAILRALRQQPQLAHVFVDQDIKAVNITLIQRDQVQDERDLSALIGEVHSRNRSSSSLSPWAVGGIVAGALVAVGGIAAAIVYAVSENAPPPGSPATTLNAGSRGGPQNTTQGGSP